MQIWAPGSVEYEVPSLVKNWEMEMFHKVDVHDYRSVDPNKYTFSLNGRKGISVEEKRKLGGFVPLLPTSLPEKLRPYN
ncbi:hypothetical protein Fmac_007613 [Flemingia macrophylla]|uniref:Uncharacterized protein n=1 Tax=Flemingia macrophylla TaxID=520843 RepID=A0ABD1MV26_9FABA